MNRNAFLFIVCGVTVLVVVAWGARERPGAPNSSALWEYKVVSAASLAGIKSVEDIWAKGFEASTAEGANKLYAEVAGNMNVIGNEGWELVCYGKEIGLIFKRMKSS